MKTALWVRRDVLSVVSMLQRTYILINQSCHPVCWSFQLCMEYMLTHTNHSMLEHHIQAVQNPGERRTEATLWSVTWWGLLNQRFALTWVAVLPSKVQPLMLSVPLL